MPMHIRAITSVITKERERGALDALVIGVTKGRDGYCDRFATPSRPWTQSRGPSFSPLASQRLWQIFTKEIGSSRLHYDHNRGRDKPFTASYGHDQKKTERDQLQAWSWPSFTPVIHLEGLIMACFTAVIKLLGAPMFLFCKIKFPRPIRCYTSFMI